MKRMTIAIAVLLLAAGAAGAQTSADNFHSGQVVLGAGFNDLNSSSSRFEEYSRMPEGVTAPTFRLFGKTTALTYDFRGYAIRGDDQRYVLRAGWGTGRLTAEYFRLPHYFGNDAKMLFTEGADGVFTVIPGVQDRLFGAVRTQFAARPAGVTYAFLNGLVSNEIGGATVTDLSLLRERGKVELDLVRDKPYAFRVAYNLEKRTGTRGTAGTAFGFGNVVELPEPVDYRTHDLAATGTLDRPWGSVRGTLKYNWFENTVPYMTFGNPFRLTDSVHASAYQAPGTASIDGAAVGRMALPPDSNAATAAVGATFKLPGKTRVIADVSYGRWTQNDTAFLPYTTNTAMVGTGFDHRTFAASSASALPTPQLDGKANVFNLNATVSSRPVRNLTMTARFRTYDFDNQTGRIELPGYARFDGVWEDIPRISVPYGYRTQRLDTTVGYDFGRVGLEAGYRFSAFHRTFREAERTFENALVFAANIRAVDGVVLRGSYEKAMRDWDSYEYELSEEASFIHEPGEVAVPVNLFAFGPDHGGPVAGRYDQAKKDLDRVTALLQLTPIDKISLSFSYLYARDNYNPDVDNRATLFGLTRASYDTFSADVDFTPTDRLSLYGFYSRENNKNSQRGRQSGATVSFNPLDDWLSEVSDKIQSFGGGATIGVLPEKLVLNLSGQYQKVDGLNDITVFTGGAPEVSRRALGGAGDIDAYDDTKLYSVTGEVKYNLPRSFSLAVGGIYQDYRIADANAAVTNYEPASLFLLGNDGSYRAKVGYVRLGYSW
jgi:MtrB/PioB family decaheme-associated outer membrane protein